MIDKYFLCDLVYCLMTEKYRLTSFVKPNISI